MDTYAGLSYFNWNLREHHAVAGLTIVMHDLGTLLPATSKTRTWLRLQADTIREQQAKRMPSEDSN